MGIEECIGEKFSENLDILNDPFGYPLIDKEIEYNRSPTCKVVDIQGIQTHTGRIIFVPGCKEFSFDIDKCPNLHVAIKAEPTFKEES